MPAIVALPAPHCCTVPAKSQIQALEQARLFPALPGTMAQRL